MDISLILAETFEGVATKLVSFILLAAAAYFIPAFFLSVLKVPHKLTKAVSFLAVCVALYYGVFEILLQFEV